MAMVVLAICATLATVLVARNVTQAHRSVRDQHRAEALAAAEVGMAHAEAVVAAGQDGGRLAGSVTADGPTWVVEIEPGQGGSASVTSVGDSAGERRSVAAELWRRSGTVERQGWHEVPVP
jgi:Tfp pilus assembly protein FimT